MIAYLRQDDVEKPRTIASSPAKPDPKCGRITTNIAHGELFLHPKGRKKERLRLRFEPAGDRAAAGDRAREVPAGMYRVTGYRQIAVGDDKATWIWSTTSPGYRALEVKAGETVNLDVRRKVVVQARAFTKKGKRRVGLVFKAERRLGNTLYRKGKRIGINWQCLDEQAKVLAEGTMRYG